VVADQVAICEFISKRVNFENVNTIANQSMKQGAVANAKEEESGAAIMIDNFSNFSEDGPVEASIDSVG